MIPLNRLAAAGVPPMPSSAAAPSQVGEAEAAQQHQELRRRGGPAAGEGQGAGEDDYLTDEGEWVKMSKSQAELDKGKL